MGINGERFGDSSNQHLTDNMVDRQHLAIVNAEAIQLVRDYMLFPEDHMLHPKRFSNSISNSISRSLGRDLSARCLSVLQFTAYVPAMSNLAT